MSYQNETYVIFDSDNDMRAYAYMKGWNKSEHIEFDFHNTHDLRPPIARACGGSHAVTVDLCENSIEGNYCEIQARI